MTEPELMTRDEAAAEIADHIKNRLSYVVIIPPSVFAAAVGRLAMLPYGTLYADNGTARILKGPTSLQAPVAAVFAKLFGMGMTGVALVPKAVRKKMLVRALGQPLPDDEAQDLVVLQGPEDHYTWPMLFVQALDDVDPAAAAAIRGDAL